MKMQNQAAVEALYSGTFVENYLDVIENLPNDIQRHLSKLREYDLVLHKELLSGLDEQLEEFEQASHNPSAQREILEKIQRGLIVAQDVGDDKLATAQAIADLVESKNRSLESSAENLDFEDHADVGPATPSSAKMPPGKAKAKAHTTKEDGPKEKPTSVKRRKKQDRNFSKDDLTEDDADPPPPPPVVPKTVGATKGARGKRPMAKKKTATGATKRATSTNNDDSDKDIDPSLDNIDPDEPTYCLCDQISYGDMIGCDNDLCPIEWFHFNCVNLSSKPKGRWFCPKCRGEKANVMKPKTQFLKELAAFNKEKEEKNGGKH